LWGNFSGSVKEHILSKIANQFFPSRCPSCSCESNDIFTAPFCKSCWSGIRRYSGPACRICSTPFSSEYSDICAGCLEDRPLFSHALFFGIYEGPLAAAIHYYKFHGIKRLHKPLGRFMLSLAPSGIDAVVPVPMTAGRLRERGFNQSLLLAKVIAGNARVPFMYEGLLKKADTLPQIGLSAVRRKSNIRGAFSATRRFDGMRLLLIDDVMTTGATAGECSKALIKAGAEKVVVLVLARASAT
jgi:ComF family protein